MFPEYRINRAKSRYYDVSLMKTISFQCEREWCSKNACSIHHINSSFRWKRNNNPKWLIALCLFHHEFIHKKNNHQNRQMLLSIVLDILKERNDNQKWTFWMQGFSRISEKDKLLV